MTKAFAYLRTSSAANVEGDSSERQRLAIVRYAANNGIELVDCFYDAAVSGADPLEDRKGYKRMLERLMANGVRMVIVEDASRFARTIIVQELGLRDMRAIGVRVVTASGTDLTDDDDTERSLIRQLMGVISEAEKRRLVTKLKGARDRKSEALGRRIEGAKGHRAEMPAMVYGAVQELVRQFPNASLAGIVNELTEAGLRTKHGRPFAPTFIAAIIKQMGLPKVDGRRKVVA